MSRPVAWSPLAGSDPVPGEPELVERAGRHYRKVALAINEAAAKLRRIAAGQDMQSEAVNAFRDSANKVAEEIARAQERYDGVGQALSAYAPQLRDAQDESTAALRQAKDAEAAQASAHRASEAAQGRIDTAAIGADTTADQGDQRRAAGTAEAAGDALAAARRRLQTAIDARDTAAQRAIGAINNVVKDAELNDGLWDNVFSKVVEWTGRIADWVAMAAGLLALLFAWFPPLAAAFAAVALVASLVSLAMKSIQLAMGDATWGKVAWAAVGVLAFGVGRAALAGLKGTVKGLRAARTLTRAQAAGRGGTRTARRAIDMSRRHGLMRNARDAAKDLRKMPDEIKDLKKVGEVPSAWRNAKSSDLAEFSGARETGNAARKAWNYSQEAGGWDNVEVRRHMIRGGSQFAAHLGATGHGHYGTYDSVSGTVEELTAPSAAEQLNLSKDGDLAQSGAASGSR